jgi:hypothetical protein
VEECGRSRRGCERSTLIKAIWDGAMLEHHLAVRRAHSGTCSRLQVPWRGQATERHGLRESESRAEQKLLREGVAGGQWAADGLVLPE